MVKVPSGPVTAKNGWGRTPAHADIQPCTSHLNFTITSGFPNVLVTRWLTIGMPRLNEEFFSAIAWTLWVVSSLLTISTGCPTRTPKTCGWYAHPFWSRTTGVGGAG